VRTKNKKPSFQGRASKVQYFIELAYLIAGVGESAAGVAGGASTFPFK